MHFLPDVYVACDVCHGNDTTADARHPLPGQSIADVLEMTVEGLRIFSPVPAIADQR